MIRARKTSKMLTDQSSRISFSLNEFSYKLSKSLHHNELLTSNLISQYPYTIHPHKIHNHCIVTGRARRVIKYYNLSSITFKELASHNLISGINKI